MTLTRLIATVSLVMLSAIAFAQDSQLTNLGRPPVDLYRFEFTGGGARAEGMGKAYLGLSDDITAGSWNPAGLFELSSPTVSLSYGSTKARGFSNSGLTIFDPRSDHTGSINGISSFNFAAPLRVKGHPFVGSVSYTKNFDEFQSLTASLNYPVTFITVRPNGFPETTVVNSVIDQRSDLDGGLVSINFSLGTKINENISSGVSMNIYTGETIRNFHENVDIPSLFDPITLQTLRLNTTTRIIDSNKFSGFNVTLGAQFKTGRVGLGLVVRTPFALSVETGRSVYSVRYINELSTIEGSDTLFYDGLLAKYDIPLVVAGGIGVDLGHNTIFAADLEYRGFSGQRVRLRDELILEPGGENTEVFTDSIPKWKNSFSVRAGVEHIFETSKGNVPIRFGGGYIPLVAPSYETVTSGSTPYKESSTSSYTLSAGTGIHWEQIRLDLAYTYTSYDWGYLQGVVFDQSNRDHHINFTFTGVF